MSMQPNDNRSKLTTFDCRGLGATAEGSLTLRNPFSSASAVQRRRTNQNNNLSPRKRKRRRMVSQESEEDNNEPSSSSITGTSTFTSASTVYSDFQKLSFASSDSNKSEPSSSEFSGWMTKKSKLAASQSNNLLKYGYAKTRAAKNEVNVKKEIKKEDDDVQVIDNDDVVIIDEVKRKGKHTASSAAPVDGSESESKSGSRKSSQPDKSRKVKAERSSQAGSQESSKSFGLFGLDDFDDWQYDTDSEDSCNVQPDLLSQMPEHVLEEIFALLPFTDLLLNVALVCTRFRDIIANPKYMVWKKRYHALKAKKDDTVADVKELFNSLGMNDLQNVLPSLPRCLHKFRCDSHDYDQELVRWLQAHKKYSWALRFLKENSADCMSNTSEDVEPWYVVAAIVALSSSVADVTQVMHLLSKSPCIWQDLIEALYCLASFLFLATTTHQALYGAHYYVFYALYLFENEWQAKISNLQSAFHAKGQQSIMKYSEGDSNLRMTHEQMRIINHPLQDNQVVKVVAFAGTGKTSTLVQFAKLRQGLKFLLVVYNKAAQLHASRVFPGNVECRTMSSLAFTEGPGHRYKHKLTSKLRPLDIKTYLDQKAQMDANKYARLVLATLDKFMASDDPCLTLAHVLQSNTSPDEDIISDEIALSVLRDAEVIWKKMTDPRDRDVRIMHDTYLKLYQLQKPVWDGYSCIMIDEAQDCTPAMLDIVLSQNCPKILVGDPNQQIYSFRGAVNALDSVRNTHTYYLSQSFRFGPEISYVAHCVLAVLKNVTHKTLVGGKQKSDVMGRYEGQLAIISRGNATLFNEAVRLLCNGNCRPHEPKASDVRPYFVGGLSSYNLGQLVDIYKLMSHMGGIKDKFICRFNSFQHLQSYAKNAKDQELHVKVGLVLQHGEKILTYVQTISDKCKREDPKFANVVFTTAHKAKGLEFDTVCLADDFNLGVSNNLSGAFTVMKILSDSNSASADLAGEYNILYVALTRAKKCLLLSESLRNVLQAAQENFEVPVLLESAQETCSYCERVISDVNDKAKSFVLYKRPLRMMNGVEHVPGMFCKKCAKPRDQLDMSTGYNIPDKARRTLQKILGTEVGDCNIFPFDAIDIFEDPAVFADLHELFE